MQPDNDLCSHLTHFLSLSLSVYLVTASRCSLSRLLRTARSPPGQYPLFPRCCAVRVLEAAEFAAASTRAMKIPALTLVRAPVSTRCLSSPADARTPGYAVTFSTHSGTNAGRYTDGESTRTPVLAGSVRELSR